MTSIPNVRAEDAGRINDTQNEERSAKIASTVEEEVVHPSTSTESAVPDDKLNGTEVLIP